MQIAVVVVVSKEADATVVAALNHMLWQSGLVKARAAWHGGQFKSSPTQKRMLTLTPKTY
jgi:hypothetical protein